MKNSLLFVLLASVLLLGCLNAPSSSNETSSSRSIQTTIQSNVITGVNQTMTEKLVKQGDSVAVLYKGSLDDGTVFDESAKHGNVPLEFKVGAHMVVPGFENAVIGMKVGDVKTVKLAPADAYGERDPKAVIEVPTAQIEEQLGQKIKEGMQLQSGNGMPVTVIKVTPQNSTLDANFPLAGKTLTFQIILKAIK